jgi:hypothetical protein
MYLPVTNISSVEVRLGVVNDPGESPPSDCPHYDADRMLHGETAVAVHMEHVSNRGGCYSTTAKRWVAVKSNARIMTK